MAALEVISQAPPSLPSAPMSVVSANGHAIRRWTPSPTAIPEGFEGFMDMYLDTLTRARAAHDELLAQAPPQLPPPQSWIDANRGMVSRLAMALREASELVSSVLPPDDAPDPVAYALLHAMWERGRATTNALAWLCIERRVLEVYGAVLNGTQGNGPIFDLDNKTSIQPVVAETLLNSGLYAAVLADLCEHLGQLAVSKNARAKMSQDQGMIRALLLTARDRSLFLLWIRKEFEKCTDEELYPAMRDVATSFNFLDAIFAEDARPAKQLLKPLKLGPVEGSRKLLDPLVKMASNASSRADTLAEFDASVTESLDRAFLRFNSGAGRKALEGLFERPMDIPRALVELEEHDVEIRMRGLNEGDVERYDEMAIRITRAMRVFTLRRRAKAIYRASPGGRAKYRAANEHQAVTKISAAWRGSKARKLYKQLRTSWKAPMEPILNDRRIEFEVEIGAEILEKLIATGTPAKKEKVISWKNIDFHLNISRKTNYLNLVLEAARELPPEWQLQVKPIVGLLDNNGTQTAKREGTMATLELKRRTVDFPGLPMSLLDREKHPEVFKGFSVVARLALSVNKWVEPSVWTSFNLSAADRMKKTKQVRLKLDKLLAKSGNATVADTKARDELFVELAASRLVDQPENGPKKLVFFALLDAAELRRNAAVAGLMGFNKWKAESNLQFNALVYPPAPGKRGGKWLGAYLSLSDDSGGDDFELPDGWWKELDFRMTLVNAQTSVYENKNMEVFSHAVFTEENLNSGLTEMGLQEAFPGDVLDKSSGFVVQSEDGKRELMVLKVEVGYHEVNKPKQAAADDLPAVTLATQAKEHARAGRLVDAILTITKAIEKEHKAPNTSHLYLRAKWNFEEEQFGAANQDIEVILGRTRAANQSNNPDRREAQLLKAQVCAKDITNYLKQPQIMKDIADDGMHALSDVLRHDPGSKLGNQLAHELDKWRDNALAALEQERKSGESAQAKRDRQCPNGRNCKTVGCKLEHPAGYQPPSVPAAPPPDPAILRRQEEERKEQEYFRMLSSWLNTMRAQLPKELPGRADIVQALFPPRGTATGAGPAVVVPKEDANGNIEIEAVSPSVLRLSDEARARLKTSITGDTARASDIRGAGRSSSAIKFWATAHTKRELVALDLENKLNQMFEGRAQWQHQKKVAEDVFEGRINVKERIFFVELEPNSYLVTAVVLNHKGFNRVIAHSANILQNVREVGMDSLLPLNPTPEEIEEEERETARLKNHAEILRDIALQFHADTMKNHDMGEGFFLPRRFLGNLDMLIETDVETGRSSAVLTRQEKEAIETACQQNSTLYIKGSAGNGKTTVLAEICKANPMAVLVLPTTRLKDQVLRSYPEINAVTVGDRIASIWPSEWRRVTFADFSDEVRKRKSTASTDEIAEMWDNKFEQSWYDDWKLEKLLKDEKDLWEHMSSVWDTVATTDDPGALEELSEFAHGFTHMFLIDEAQSLTQLQVKLLALSCGYPNRVVVGMDSKQSVGKQSAARRTGVRRALREATDLAKMTKFEHKTVNLSINFRCPYGVLKVLDAVLQSWLKVHFKSEFDDFSVDTVVRSSLWDSPPVFLCDSAESARKVLEAARLQFVVLHTGKMPTTTFADMNPLLTLGIDDCRGLEFEELCVLEHPLRMTPLKLFRELAASKDLSERQMDQVRDTITSWLVLMTRCMFGAIWIEDRRHPIVAKLLQEQNAILLETNTEEEIATAVAMLQRARQDAVGDSGSGSLLTALSKLMALIGDRVEVHKTFSNYATPAAQLIRRITGREDDELEVGLLAVSDVLSKIDFRQLPPKDDQKTALALKHYGPLIYSVIKRALDERGKATKGAAESQAALNEAKEAADKVKNQLQALGFST